MLQPKQFGEMAKELRQPDGGYTKSVTTGKDAEPGYLVSMTGYNQQFKANVNVTRNNIKAHLAQHANILSKPGRYAGAWNDPDSGVKHLDVTQRFTSHHRAINTMWANDEDALYNSHEWRSERNMLGRGAPKGSTLQGQLPQGVSPMTPEGYQRLQKIAKRKAR